MKYLNKYFFYFLDLVRVCPFCCSSSCKLFSSNYTLSPMLGMENLDWMVSGCYETQILVQWFPNPVAHLYLQASLFNMQIPGP